MSKPLKKVVTVRKVLQPDELNRYHGIQEKDSNYFKNSRQVLKQAL